ncbi:hypothetical protein HAX54_027600, partial [Datura stramonium]|nr:hypothetical protein [Datura stramonium]
MEDLKAPSDFARMVLIVEQTGSDDSIRTRVHKRGETVTWKGNAPLTMKRNTMRMIGVTKNITPREEGFQNKIAQGQVNPFKVEFITYVKEIHSRRDQIPRAPPVIKGMNSKKYLQLPYKLSAKLMFIPKKFKMSNILRYN